MKRLMICFIVMLFLMKPLEVQAARLNGDEALGGFSYLMQCAYQNKLPSGRYSEWYYEAYERFHYEIPLDEESRAILERIVEAEATGGNIEQKMNVASCVLARVQSSDWANTVHDVVFEHSGNTWQFTPISDKRYYSVSISEDTITAVDEVLRKGLTHECLWFCSKGSYERQDENGNYISWHRRHLKYAFYDGEHVYFY